MKDAFDVKALVAVNIGAETEELPDEIRKQFPKESEALGAWGTGGVLVGLTPGVNDESAKLVRDFTPTQNELAVLARHYLNEANDLIHFWETTHSYGSDYSRAEAFAWRRLETIKQTLGKTEFDAAVAETDKHWKKVFDELAASPRCERCELPCSSTGHCEVCAGGEDKGVVEDGRRPTQRDRTH